MIPAKNLTLKDFETITTSDIENYLDYSFKLPSKKGDKDSNASICTIRRKYASLCSFYDFFYKEALINSNPIRRLTAPPNINIPSPTLKSDDVNELVEFVEKGVLPGKLAAYQKHFRERDTAIFVLLTSSGLKASEILKIKISDLHLDELYIELLDRRYSRVSISKYAAQKIALYLTKRFEMIPEYGYENVLFLSSHGTQMVMRTLQVMIKKYTTALFGGKYNITAKDLTATFRNNLFNSLHSVQSTALITGYSEETIYKVYRADLIEIQANIENKYTPLRKGFRL